MATLSKTPERSVSEDAETPPANTSRSASSAEQVSQIQETPASQVNVGVYYFFNNKYYEQENLNAYKKSLIEKNKQLQSEYEQNIRQINYVNEIVEKGEKITKRRDILVGSQRIANSRRSNKGSTDRDNYPSLLGHIKLNADLARAAEQDDYLVSDDVRVKSGRLKRLNKNLGDLVESETGSSSVGNSPSGESKQGGGRKKSKRRRQKKSKKVKNIRKRKSRKKKLKKSRSKK